MATETERLERETEQTRAELEQTLGELRARMSPGQLFDQATDYFRNSGGRTYLHNLREEVVHNPVPITLIGAGIAWLAISGAMGRRGNGHAYRGREDMARDWGRTAGVADDLARGGHGPSAMQRAKDTAQQWAQNARETAGDWAERARETVSSAGDDATDTGSRWRDEGSDVRDRMSTAYDETVSRARQSAEGWSDQARATMEDTRETLRDGAERVRERAGEARERIAEGMESARERAGELYERTAHGFRRVTRGASQLGQTARQAMRSDGALLNFCREQPMVVAGLGLAFGAALAAMIPTSRVERDTLGETSRRMQDRVKETASDTWRAVGGERSDWDERARNDGEGAWREEGSAQAANDADSTATEPSNIGRSEQPSFAQRRERWDSDAMGSREAAADVERGVRQGDRASNIETEPGRAPYAEAAEAGAAGGGVAPGEETKQRT